jgi:Fe-S-cluster containining protein
MNAESSIVDLQPAVASAAQRPDVRAAIADIYASLQQEIDLRRPLCTSSGRCCHFETFGHRLYVTTMELAAFSHALQHAPADREAVVPLSGRSLPILKFTAGTSTPGCPFQLNELCSVHIIRPFGCRIFFCDESSTDWQHAQYERFHGELKRLHVQLNVPYFYVEWRQALAALGSSTCK